MADYPTFGLENWDDELKAYIDDADTAVANAAQLAASNAESAANSYTDGAVAGLDTPAWASISDKPATFSPSAHAHPISDVTDLQTTLDAKAADNAVVKLTGNQTIAGTKTFSSAPSVPDGSFTTAKVTGLATSLTDLASRSNHTGTEPVSALPTSVVLSVVVPAGGPAPARPDADSGRIVIWRVTDLADAPALVSSGTAGRYEVDIVALREA